MKRLYIIPHIHPPLGTFVKSSPYIRKLTKELYGTITDFLDEAFSLLKDENIDFVFKEGIPEQRTAVDFDHQKMEPYSSRIINFAKTKGAIFGKTEDMSASNDEELVIRLMLKFGFIGPVYRVLNKIDDIISRRRDIEFGRNISKQLFENSSGVLLYGAGHNVVGYLDEDIDVIPLSRFCVIDDKRQVYKLELLDPKSGRTVNSYTIDFTTI